VIPDYTAGILMTSIFIFALKQKRSKTLVRQFFQLIRLKPMLRMGGDSAAMERMTFLRKPPGLHVAKFTICILQHDSTNRRFNFVELTASRRFGWRG
jgi:hypothetical protein